MFYSVSEDIANPKWAMIARRRFVSLRKYLLDIN